MAVKYCRVCKTRAPETATVCAKCGKPLAVMGGFQVELLTLQILLEKLAQLSVIVDKQNRNHNLQR